MHRSIVPLLLALLLLAAAPAVAATGQQPMKLTDQPGYLPLGELSLFHSDDLSVEINLEGPLLRMVAGATRQEDPDFSSVIANLKAIQVRVLPVATTAQETVKGKIGRTTRWLEDRGWQSTMRVREGGEEFYIYLKESDGKIQGLTLLAFEPTEAVVINIVGRIDPDQLGRLGQRLNMPQLQKAAPKEKEKKQP